MSTRQASLLIQPQLKYKLRAKDSVIKQNDVKRFKTYSQPSAGADERQIIWNQCFCSATKEEQKLTLHPLRYKTFIVPDRDRILLNYFVPLACVCGSDCQDSQRPQVEGLLAEVRLSEAPYLDEDYIMTSNGHFSSVGDVDGGDYQHGVQVVDGDKEFNPNLSKYLIHENVTPAGFNYHLISVFGSQSTGKSTLLNTLFKTDFSVMSETERRQTTKGIWLSKNKRTASNEKEKMADNILVMDVEGTDGREPLFTGQLTAAHKSGVAEFSEAVSSAVKAGQKKGASYDFAEIVTRERKLAIEKFEKEAGTVVVEGAPWSDYKQELSLYQKDLEKISSQLRKDEMRRLATRVERWVRSRLGDSIDLEFNALGSGRGGSRAPEDGEKPSEKTIWDRIWSLFVNTVLDAERRFTERAKSFDASLEEVDVGLWRLRRKSWGVLRSKIDEEMMEGNILLKLRENFEDKFRYDDLGAADGVYVEAKRSAIGGITQVPLYFYGLLLALGWNEIIAVLRNPIYFLFLLVIGVGAYVTFRLNLWGPMINMAEAASRQAVEEGKRRLREFLESSDTGRQAMAMSGRNSTRVEEYEMSSNLKSKGRRSTTDDDDDDDDL
ncbi:hypothetical protein TEQG_03981 [Trichophyton equinum CBS 127.97]|uniref:GB1/RHD3-type G domain-containing protein n=1 Tax=Trichophyton equinum (strain ATCC MYA-4606 / CBS 127.97) TaxID=559882 RepID=F2PS52_TRIEC|nr:hypothetical protein TEQG_03981 [Trichophyton equinum CBS 127.97]